ncbi:37S ribosomal protein S9, mitochondrial [Myotisia sp. PD_48]|nr:37S ribosomal protein S9, mitochondrial [Myotisia sp. PD_48]
MPWRRPGLALQALRQSYIEPCFIHRSYTPISRLLPQQQSFSTTLLVRDASNSLTLLDAPSKPARIIPASPSYFTGSPKFTDYELKVQALYSKYNALPQYGPNESPRVVWLRKDQFTNKIKEEISVSRYAKLIKTLRKMNKIREEVLPREVMDIMDVFSLPRNLQDGTIKPKTPDENGRARGIGRRKTSSATAWVVEGDGQVLINGKPLTQAFPRIHDRESAVWALKATNRLDKYNVWVVVRGGGVTGQAEATTLAVAKALLVHEPGLKVALRRAGVVRTDPRQVERKKPGKVKARKMPAWVKR